jgi:hypothetical protein
MLIAQFDTLPNYGNRHNVFLAVVTTAAYQEMIAKGVPSKYAQTLVGDLGWKIYNWLFTIVALPFRITNRNPGKRMERILRALMIFPFSAPGAPGYEVKVWTEKSNTYTHWSHCPPQFMIGQVQMSSRMIISMGIILACILYPRGIRFVICVGMGAQRMQMREIINLIFRSAVNNFSLRWAETHLTEHSTGLAALAR